jgi:hypothetical protein
MVDIYTTNLAVIQQRWPALKQFLEQQTTELLNVELVEGLSSTIKIDGIQLSSRHDRLKEAEQQVASIEKKTEIHLYGCGLGDVPRELLKRQQLEKLHIHILNEQLFAFCLHLLLHDDWLSDPRVILQMAAEHKEIQLPFFAIPAELFLASNLNAKMRDRLVAEIELPFVNQKFKPQNASIQNRIKQNLSFLASDPDVAVLFNSFKNQPAFVLASGPSLELHYQKLREIRAQEQRPVFIALDTAVRPLITNGIEPDFVISIDQHITTGHFPVSLSDMVKLIYFPLAQSCTLSFWPGPRYAAYSQSAIYDEVTQLIPKTRLFSSGSVLHPAVDFAVHLGVKSITLFGADFSYPLNKTHSGWADGALGEPVAAAKYWVLNGKGERVKTLLNFRSYLCALERYIARHPEVQFFNSSQIGALIDGTTFHPEFVQ